MLTPNEVEFSFDSSYGYTFTDDGYGYVSGGSLNANGMAFVIFTPCWTFAFVLYLMLTSASAHTRTHKPIGRFFSKKIALAVDFLSAVFWFAGFITFAVSTKAASCELTPNSSCGLIVTNIVVGICAWYEACSGICTLYLLTDRQHHLYRNHSLGCASHDSYPQCAFREIHSWEALLDNTTLQQLPIEAKIYRKDFMEISDTKGTIVERIVTQTVLMD